MSKKQTLGPDHWCLTLSTTTAHSTVVLASHLSLLTEEQSCFAELHLYKALHINIIVLIPLIELAFPIGRSIHLVHLISFALQQKQPGAL